MTSAHPIDTQAFPADQLAAASPATARATTSQCTPAPGTGTGTGGLEVKIPELRCGELLRARRRWSGETGHTSHHRRQRTAPARGCPGSWVPRWNRFGGRTWGNIHPAVASGQVR